MVVRANGDLTSFLLVSMNFFRRLFSRSTNPSASALAFLTSSYEEMIKQNKAHAKTWLYGKEKSWSADLEAGIIVFNFAGDLSGTSDFQSIGVYNESESSFTWAWAHNSVPRSLRKHAKLAKVWEHQHGHPAFTTKTVQCSMEEAWHYAAATRKLAGAKSVYRGRVGNLYIFMTTDEIHINTESKKAHWATNRKGKRW